MLQRFWKDDQGQATIEYVMMLAFAATLGTLLGKNFFMPLMNATTARLKNTIESLLFTPQGMHGRFPSP